MGRLLGAGEGDATWRGETDAAGGRCAPRTTRLKRIEDRAFWRAVGRIARDQDRTGELGWREPSYCDLAPVVNHGGRRCATSNGVHRGRLKAKRLRELVGNVMSEFSSAPIESQVSTAAVTGLCRKQ